MVLYGGTSKQNGGSTLRCCPLLTIQPQKCLLSIPSFPAPGEILWYVEIHVGARRHTRAFVFLNGKFPYVCNMHGCPTSIPWDAPLHHWESRLGCRLGPARRPGWHGSLWLHIPNAFYSATAFGSVRLWPDRYDLGLGLLLLKDRLGVSAAGKFHLKMA